MTIQKREIANSINLDIVKGVYDNFDKLKDRLEYIAHKLILSIYVTGKELTPGEKRTLRENDYLVNNYKKLSYGREDY